jgi:predicted phage baseplate assembly protein
LPLVAPNLDTRTFDDLVQEARLRIPRYTPEWTDFNESDPGITFVELFVWITELMLYQMNQVPERNYIKFLRLLGMELRPAQPAIAHVTFTAMPGAQVQSVPLRSQLSAQPPAGGQALIFETDAGLDLIRVSLTDVQVYDGSAFTVVTQANETPGTGFRPLGWVPQVGSALYLGFSESNPPAVAPVFPQEIRMRVFLPPSAQAGGPQNVSDALTPPAAPVDLVWEYRPNPASKYWLPLSVYQDESLAFTAEGYILLEGPKTISQTIVEGGKIADPRYWLRARLNKGTYPAGLEPQIDFVRPNTVPAENLSTVQQEVVGTSDGTPHQSFPLARNPVLQGSLSLSVEVAGEPPESWVQVEDFLASGKEDPHYVLNTNTGVILFGDGTNGLIPPASAQIIANEYRYGGGLAGNVAAGQINAAITGVADATNERPAVGGADEQSVDDLKEQAPHKLRSRNRAVTSEDFAALAQQAGGVAKATAIPLAHPDYPGVDVPGAVTVVIVPDSKGLPPQPSADQIRYVCQYLEQFRLLTTELYVKGPVYQAISVQATVAAQPYAAFGAIEQNIVCALNQYLSPLGNADSTCPAGSPPQMSQSGSGLASRNGWDFGEDLYPTNLFGVILAVSGVAAVIRLSLTVNGQPYDKLTQAVSVPRDGLLYGTDHQITVIPLTKS